MASVVTPAHVSSRKLLQCSSWKTKRLSCELSPPPSSWKEGRRMISISLVLSHFLLIPNNANAEVNFMDKYVKRKKLEPLETYVPAVILTQFQIKDLGNVGFSLTAAFVMLVDIQIFVNLRDFGPFGMYAFILLIHVSESSSHYFPCSLFTTRIAVEKTLEGAEPQFALCRSLLRSGPAASLRVNIRAVAQYASDSGNGKTASNNVDECLRSLEELDSLLLRASRNDPEASVKSMKAKVRSAFIALDSLLQTVPSDVLSKGKVIADSYLDREDAVEIESSDPDIKQLESIL
ncbi:hypothetical protein TSUD_314790 [Trifolium subterraneum]|uniref:DUF7880 domain-containing protein n=1 Tax=Trifolium subterraneum TaxID=3900 RepID=A0A2Z6MN81_TRISU|nr:hypothetical protein TSUD_314790 [Trifolium subterraneum]